MDIRRIVDAHFKLNLLLSTLLSKKERFLFLNSSSKVVEPGFDSHKKPQNSIWRLDDEVSQKTLDGMLGVRAISKIDKKLLLGVLHTQDKPKKSVKEPKPIDPFTQ